MKFVFSAEDWRRIERFLTQLENRVGFRRSLEDLIRQWSDFVSEVEAGYENLYIEDYENDLCIRDILQKLIESLSPFGANALERLLKPIDNRFVRATMPVKRPLLPRISEETRGFWWYRVPKNPGEDLLRDLQQGGFI